MGEPHKVTFTRLKGYEIKVKMAWGLVEDDLQPDDAADLDLITATDHYYDGADSEEEVLDEFHSTVAISCLDDFDIKVIPVYETL